MPAAPAIRSTVVSKAVLAAALAAVAFPEAAQDAETEEPRTIRVILGPQIVPRFPGASGQANPQPDRHRSMARHDSVDSEPGKNR